MPTITTTSLTTSITISTPLVLLPASGAWKTMEHGAPSRTESVPYFNGPTAQALLEGPGHGGSHRTTAESNGDSNALEFGLEFGSVLVETLQTPASVSD